ncbi:MAG TPA: M50 family metallopeptidase [Candidatus Angelobacter sp.]
MTTPATVQASPTPILDRQSPLPPPASRAAGALIPLAVWFGLSFVTAFYMFGHPPVLQPFMKRVFAGFNQDWTPVGFVLIVPLAIFLAVAIHELAHVLAGAAVGFRFNSLRIGRIQFDRPFRFSIYRGKGTGSGGWASMFPVKQDKLVSRAVAMLFAGPAANLLTVALLLRSSASLGPFSSMFLLVSLALGVINLLPFRSRAVHSDGDRILMLLRNRSRGERWVAMLRLLAELRDGAMPESLSPAYLSKAIVVRDQSPDTVSAHSLAYSAAFHQHKDEEAAGMLEVCLQYSGYTAPVVRHALMTDAAVFQARRRRNPEVAQQWLAELPKTPEIPWLRPRAEAAILEAQGDLPAAIKKLDETERLILAAPNQAQREISLRFIHRWQSELKAQLA